MSVHPSESGEVNREIYHELASIDAAARTVRVIGLARMHPEGRLELPAGDGTRAVLDGIDLGPDYVHKLFAEAERRPPWWDAERQAMVLRCADLRGASLRRANLQHAAMEEARLAGADLAGANLQHVDLSGGDIEGALLENADLRKAILRFARGARCVLEEAKLQGADLWGAELAGADVRNADLQGAILQEANLQGADLAAADLRGAVLKQANLKGADLRGADLRGAALGGADLTGAVLRDARLLELDLGDCVLTHVQMAGARLEKTLLDKDQLGGAIGEETAREYGPARKGYLALERNFTELGDHDAARWAYLRRRRMEKLEAGQSARAEARSGHWMAAVRFALKFAGDQVVEWVCNYGESVGRVLATLLAVYVGFLLLYGVTGAVLRVEQTPAGPVSAPTYNPSDLALYSLASMTSTGSIPSYLVPRNAASYLLSGLQTLMSLFLTGLMGFVAGNRIRR